VNLITHPDYIVTDKAYDALMAIHKRHNRVFALAFDLDGLRNLCRHHSINPDA
jgi:hypothetical protein